MKHTLENPPKAKIDTTISEGDVLPYLGGIEVMDTLGHTIGHSEFYHHASKTLIAGDPLIIKEDQLYLTHSSLTYQIDQARHSKKI